MRELAFLVTGLSEDDARKLRRRRPSRAPARVVGWALVGVALLYLLAGAKRVVQITSPLSGTTTLDAQILVAGRATGIQADAVTLEVNGSPQTVPVFNGAFEAQVSLVLGGNAIRASANGISSEPRTITRNPRPVIRINKPLDNAPTTRAEIDVNGTVEHSDERAVTLEVNGASQLVSVINGQFSARALLVAGHNVIRALLNDASPAAIEVFRFETGIAITSPSDGYTTDQPTLEVGGNVANSIAASITLNVNEARRTVTVQNGGFASDVLLRVGKNRIRAFIENVSSNEIVVTRTLPPVIITLTSPLSGSTQVPIAQVRGTIQNGRTNNVTVMVNGYGRVMPVRGEVFALDVRLKIGDNSIRVLQGDAASAPVVVNLAPPPPPPILIEITEPPSATMQASPGNLFAKVRGTITNQRSATLTLTVNGVAHSLGIKNNRFTLDDVELTIGDNHIQASQDDAFSNKVVVTLFKPKTLIEITPRTDQTQSPSVTVTGTIKNPSSRTVILTVNGIESNVTTKNDAFVKDVQLQIGDNSIRARQDGSSSNEVIVRRLPPPSVKITSPPNGSDADQSVTVTGRVDHAPDATSIRFTVNGDSKNVRIRDGRFAAEATLIPGKNKIEASVKGASAQITLVRPNIIVNQPAPKIFIDSPNEPITEQRRQDVRGRVEHGEAAGLTLTLNGKTLQVDTGPGEFHSTVTLRPGKNLIRASLGNEYAEVTVTLEVKDKPPDKTPDKAPDKTPDKSPDKAPDRQPDKAPDKTRDKTPDRPPDKTPDKTPDKAPDKTRDNTPDKTPDKPVDPCRRINCDCENVKATLSMFDTASAGSAAVNIQTFSFSASITGSQSRRPPRDRRVQCLEAEDELKKNCGATGKVEGFCPANASGPKAWPTPAETKKARSGRLKKVLEKDKEGDKKP